MTQRVVSKDGRSILFPSWRSYIGEGLLLLLLFDGLFPLALVGLKFEETGLELVLGVGSTYDDSKYIKYDFRRGLRGEQGKLDGVEGEMGGSTGGWEEKMGERMAMARIGVILPARTITKRGREGITGRATWLEEATSAREAETPWGRGVDRAKVMLGKSSSRYGGN